ncbi:hypothetical protein HRI_002487500 [Hibiscus trionum]|uniref:Uncharacterized protein n=1 Tax=Hibiscus trionum TaxID=183268 RepID=A0A9W7I3H5_HIBTR|nr:hypothetical protein HRI_002487500 [Hibiscus trionum]
MVAPYAQEVGIQTSRFGHLEGTGRWFDSSSKTGNCFLVAILPDAVHPALSYQEEIHSSLNRVHRSGTP